MRAIARYEKPCSRLRETLFKAYIARGNNGNNADNNAIIRETVRLRAENAQLLGHATFAHFTLTENMAKTPDNVGDLLMKLWIPALDNAKRERDALQQVADAEGDTLQIAAWDWWYYSEKLRQQRYAIDESALKAYFPMPAVRAGAFDVANRLWGLSFSPRKDIPVYHPDVEVFCVPPGCRSLRGPHCRWQSPWTALYRLLRAR